MIKYSKTVQADNEKMDHVQRAVQLFTSGYNCSQSVFAAFCDVTGMDEKTALRIASPFGGGMGRMREVCGTCSAVFMVVGMLDGYDSCETDDAKKELYKRIQELGGKFKEKNGGTFICRELLQGLAVSNDHVPTPRTEEYYKVRPCVKFVKCAAEILQEYIDTRNERA